MRVSHRFGTPEPGKLEVTVIVTNHGETEEQVEMGLITWGQGRKNYGKVSVAEQLDQDLLPKRNIRHTFDVVDLPPLPIGPLFRPYAVLATGQFIQPEEVAAFSDSGTDDDTLSLFEEFDYGPITEGPPLDDDDDGTATPRYVSGH